MKKIYLVITGALLILLIIISILLSLIKKPATNIQKNAPFPTSIPRQENSVLPSVQKDTASLPTEGQSFDISRISPVENEDFKLQYSPKLNKVVVEKKTPKAEGQFINWAKENKLAQLVENPDLTIIIEQGKNPGDPSLMIELLNIFMNFDQGSGTTGSSPTPTSPRPTKRPTKEDKSSTATSFTYFAQCGDFGNLSLPDGCNLCNAGCGPTTVSMIASSYLGAKYDPKTIVNLYESNGYLLGCDGSRYTDAHELLKSLGLKTTDYLIFESEKAETVVPDLRKYLSSGWTFFTLASFCEGGCGHYFWITDIDGQGNIFAYDPAYGRYEIPYNENSRYPYPLYRLAFGVKK